jgi:beta-galactosidase
MKVNAYLYLWLLTFLFLNQSYAQLQRGEENFNSNWLFARYGMQPDGSRIPEPGPQMRKFKFSASSEELGLSSSPYLAMDHDESSYWQASNLDKNPWILIDLVNVISVQKANTISNADSKLTIVEGSNDKKSWGKLPGNYRFIKISYSGTPKDEPFKIREIELINKSGATIKNELEKKSISSLTPSFVDAKWRKLNLPHDWGIEGPFRLDLDGNTGKLPWRAIGWYRKHFTISSSEKGKQFYLDFDGAMANAEVYLNGKKIGERPFGYSSFRVDLTPYILFDKPNVVAVRLNTEELGSRWYPGAGIYRDVRLVKVNPIHVSHWGAFVTTPEITTESATANVAVSLENNSAKLTESSISVSIFELDKDDNVGKKVADSEKELLSLGANQTVQGKLNVKVANPKLWSLEETNRYLARVSVYSSGKLVDVCDTPFGIRTIKFTHDNGFLLNGKRVQLNGTCNHHDLGALGSAFNMSALERQLTILKEMGTNALRTSHNPPAPGFLTLADKMGFLVMDETFDCWEAEKTANDYASHFKEWHKKDIEMLVCRDRNHPSVIMWSTGNEVKEQYSPELGIAQRLTNIVHEFDTTRPVTFGASYPSKSAMNGTELQVDVHGMNYASGMAYGGPNFYGEFLDKKGHENLVGYGSETSSTVSSRGIYFDTPFQVSSYDAWAPDWGSLPDQEFAALDKFPEIAGEFVWTGFDYLGEPTPFSSDATLLLNYAGLSEADLEKEKEKLKKIEENRPPSRSSYFGMVDLAGFPKDRYYLYQSRWKPDLKMAHILPHWNFPDRIGKITPVFVYTSGDEAELFLNGKSQGRIKRQSGEYRLKWKEVVYEPGELKVVTYKNGQDWATSSVKTSGKAMKLLLSTEKQTIDFTKNEFAFVKITIADEQGNLVPNATNLISCKIKGEGEIVATDNGDAASLITFSNPTRPAFSGLMLAIVKAKSAKKGKIILRVESEGLEAGEIEINVK